MVTVEKAKEIIEKNYSCSEGSFVAELNDKDLFSPELFWEYYNSITILVIGMSNRGNKPLVHVPFGPL